jgi:ribosomal-protein-serine acetyltransferase
MTIVIDDHISLELIAAKHAEPLYAIINSNRTHLSKFLPWVESMQSVEDFSSYINNSELLHQQRKELSFAILLDKIPVGKIGLHYINHQDKNASVGYWLSKNAEGKGIITISCKALIGYGFQALNLHRIEIKVATGNLKSQAIAERLHFKKEAVLRQAEWVNNQFHDLLIYSILDFEWAEKCKRQ